LVRKGFDRERLLTYTKVMKVLEINGTG